MHAIHAAVILLALSLGAPPQADVTGTWEVAVLGARGTMRFTLTVTKGEAGLGAMLTAPNGENRAATIATDRNAVTIRFDLDNPGDPVRVVLTGTIDGERMKGSADVGGRAAADWTATRRKIRPHEEFWGHLEKLCDGAFEGKVVEAPPTDTTFAGKRLVMHVR